MLTITPEIEEAADRLEKAASAASEYHFMSRRVLPSYFEPEGFERIGRGSHRVAFRGPGGLVYKVELRLGANLTEAETFSWARTRAHLPAEVRLADQALVGMISVMEYVDGVTFADVIDSGEGWAGWEVEDLKDLNNTLDAYSGLDDLHAGNLMIDNTGTVVVVDLSSGTS